MRLPLVLRLVMGVRVGSMAGICFCSGFFSKHSMVGLAGELGVSGLVFFALCGLGMVATAWYRGRLFMFGAKTGKLSVTRSYQLVVPLFSTVGAVLFGKLMVWEVCFFAPLVVLVNFFFFGLVAGLISVRFYRLVVSSIFFSQLSVGVPVNYGNGEFSDLRELGFVFGGVALAEGLVSKWRFSVFLLVLLL